MNKLFKMSIIVILTLSCSTVNKTQLTEIIEEEEVVVVKSVLPTHCTRDGRKCTIHGFKIDAEVPSKGEEQALKQITEVVNNYAINGTVNIYGHTDATGSVKYNMELSRKRANNIKKFLIKYGLKKEIRINKVKGYGKSRPIAINNTPEGRYQNRRVVLTFDNLDLDNE